MGAGEWSVATLPPIDDAAFHGIAGNWARQVGGEVEAHENGILVATLVGGLRDRGRPAYLFERHAARRQFVGVPRRADELGQERRDDLGVVTAARAR